MQGPVEVESSPQACERDSAAQAAGFKPQAQTGFCAQLRVVEHKFWFPEEVLFVLFLGVGFEDSVVTRWGGQKSH